MSVIFLGPLGLPFWTAFFKGVLCNVFVCLAVWMALAGRSVVDKAVAIVFPISAFVAAGFEHSVANMYFIPLAMLLEHGEPIGPMVQTLTWGGFFNILVPVLLGNVLGGSVFVGFVYHSYTRHPRRHRALAQHQHRHLRVGQHLLCFTAQQ